MFVIGFTVGALLAIALSVALEGVVFHQTKKRTIARWRRRQPHGIRKSAIADYFPVRYYKPPDFLPEDYTRRKRVKEPFPIYNVIRQLSQTGSCRAVRIGGIWR